MNNGQSIMLRIPSHPSNIAHVEPFVEQLVERYKISPDIYGNILITLTEAVTNAIKHGNDSDESKTVEVRLNQKDDELRFSITDEGHGFDYDNLPDPTAPENLLKIGGRGVFLMRQLCDKIIFHDNGSTVEIRFRL